MMLPLKEQIQQVPELPGIYKYFDQHNTLLYVGKAKNLKKRVASYFSAKKNVSAKTRLLVKLIRKIEYIVVNNEHEALLLENTLIKEHQPRFNIQLRDDKTYPWICIKKEPFPRVFATRNIVQDGSEYYGPFSNVGSMKSLLKLIKNTYKLRTCNYHLSPENIQKKKFKVCLDYHIGICAAPCVGYQTEEAYNTSLEQIRKIVKGELQPVIEELRKQMLLYAKELQFEKAQQVKEQIATLEKYKANATVVSPRVLNIDVFHIISDEKNAYVSYLKVNKGAIIQGQTIEIKKKLDEPDEKLLTFAVVELRSRFNSTAKEIVTPIMLNDLQGLFKITVPQRGDKKKLLNLALTNAQTYKAERQKRIEKQNPHLKIERILKQLQKDLRLKELPVHIECFDNSNFQGTNAVSACVVFKNAKPSKKDYRHFNIKTVEGPNDFASMEEVVYRRYKRLLEENQGLPQLIVIDGGKGQLSAALKSLKKLNLHQKIAIIGIAKKLEEIFFPNDPYPLYIDKKSESLKLIQHIRNEAHRFSLSHHRKKRSKASVQSSLDKIPGIGQKTKQQLFKTFKSLQNIRAASLEEFQLLFGKKRGKTIHQNIQQYL